MLPCYPGFWPSGKYTYEHFEKTWLFPNMILEKGSTPTHPFFFLFYSESSGSCLKAVNIKWSSTFIILLFTSPPISSSMNIVVHQQVKCRDKIYFLLSDCVNVSCCWWQLTSGISWYIVCCCNDAPGIVLVLCCQCDDTDGTTWRRRSWQRWRFSSCCLRCS